MLSLLLTLALGGCIADCDRPPPMRGLGTAQTHQYVAAPLFQFAPTPDGYGRVVGLEPAHDLCSVLSPADKVGNWWCLAGDGTMASGSVTTLSATGTPAMTTQTRSVCPNGPNCASATMLMAGGVGGPSAGQGGYKSAAMAPPAGAWSACQLVSLGYSAAGIYQNLLTFAESGASLAVTWQSSPGSGATALYFGGVLRRTLTLTLGAHHLACVTSGGSTGQAYLDGTAEGASFTSTLGAFGNQSWRVSGYGDGSYPMSNASAGIRGTFFVESELSAARIAAIARAVLADTPTGTKGEALTFTRATASSCALDANETELTYLPSGRPCITRGGLSVYRGGTNICLRSEEIDNAAWLKFGNIVAAPTVTADYGLAPDGSKTAERIQYVAVNNANEESSVYQNVGGACVGALCTLSVWVKSTDGVSSGTLYIASAANGVDGFDSHACSYSGAWARCSFQKTAAGGFAYFWTGNVRNIDGNQPANDVLLWGAQAEAIAYLTPYVRTTSASATRNIETASFAVTYGSSIETQGSAALDFTPAYSQAAGQNGWLIGHRGNSRFIYFQSPNLLAYDGTANPSVAKGFVAQTLIRKFNAWKAGASASSLNGTAWTMSADGFDDADNNALRLGEQSAIVTGAADGILGNVCLDSSFLRCR